MTIMVCGNFAFGKGALHNLQHGCFNTAIGTGAGECLVMGSGNLFIGNLAGHSVRQGNCLLIATNVDESALALTTDANDIMLILQSWPRIDCHLNMLKSTVSLEEYAFAQLQLEKLRMHLITRLCNDENEK
jgi:hypothetical protein